MQNEDVFKDSPDAHQQASNPDTAQQTEYAQIGKAKFGFQKIYIGYAVAGIGLLFGAYTLLGSLFSSSNQVIRSSDDQSVEQQWDKVVPHPMEKRMLQSGNQYVDEKQTDFQNLRQMQSETAETLKASYLTLAKHIKSLELQVTQIQASLNKLLAAHEDSDQIQTTLHSIETLLQSINTARINSIDKLTLTAIVDGRAWLEDAKGHSLTVVTNDDIPGYGKVLRIDQEKNKVYMSSGYIFQ